MGIIVIKWDNILKEVNKLCLQIVIILLKKLRNQGNFPLIDEKEDQRQGKDVYHNKLWKVVKEMGIPGRGHASLWLLEPLRRGRHKTQAQPNPRCCGGPENWNCTQRRAHSIQSSREPEQCRRGSTDTPVWGKPSVAGTRGVLPTHRDVCSAPPSPQQDWTELANLNKRSPPPACARAEIRHRRDGKQEPNKQREPLQKGPVQRIKIPDGNTDYTGRGL